MYVAKTKVLISCAVTAQLICTFVFVYAKTRFKHETAHFGSDLAFKLFSEGEMVVLLPSI